MSGDLPVGREPVRDRIGCIWWRDGCSTSVRFFVGDTLGLQGVSRRCPPDTDKKNFGGGTLELKTSTGISRQSLNCTAVTDFCKWLRDKSETGRSVEYVPVHICLRHNSESEAAQLSWSSPPSIALSAEDVARRELLLRASDQTTLLVISFIAISLATSTLAWFIADEARKSRTK